MSAGLTRPEAGGALTGGNWQHDPDLLPAMQQEQRSGLGLDSFYLDLLCTGVPVSARKPVSVGCPLGCPPVSDHIMSAHPASVARQFQSATITIPT
jgi:hypothetical protein